MSVQRAFQQVVDTLDRLAVPYMVGGSIASSVHGIYRSTNDIDIVAAVGEEHILPFAAALEGAFYTDAATMREALRQGRSFNVIHFATGYKFDIFPAAGNPYFQMQLSRSELQEVPVGEGHNIRCSVATAEDILLAKLVWYRAGGEQSERQWNDVRGIRSVRGVHLDRVYMKEWAQHLKVDDLLEKLLSEQTPI